MRLAFFSTGKERKGPVDNALPKAFAAVDESMGSYSDQITPFLRNFAASFSREGELDDSARTATLPLDNRSEERTLSSVFTASLFFVFFQVTVFLSPVPEALEA
jgi:hypothetical protein